MWAPLVSRRRRRKNPFLLLRPPSSKSWVLGWQQICTNRGGGGKGGKKSGYRNFLSPFFAVLNMGCGVRRRSPVVESSLTSFLDPPKELCKSLWTALGGFVVINVPRWLFPEIAAAAKLLASRRVRKAKKDTRKENKFTDLAPFPRNKRWPHRVTFSISSSFLLSRHYSECIALLPPPPHIHNYSQTTINYSASGGGGGGKRDLIMECLTQGAICKQHQVSQSQKRKIIFGSTLSKVGETGTHTTKKKEKKRERETTTPRREGRSEMIMIIGSSGDARPSLFLFSSLRARQQQSKWESENWVEKEGKSASMCTQGTFQAQTRV